MTSQAIITAFATELEKSVSKICCCTVTKSLKFFSLTVDKPFERIKLKQKQNPNNIDLEKIREFLRLTFHATFSKLAHKRLTTNLLQTFLHMYLYYFLTVWKRISHCIFRFRNHQKLNPRQDHPRHQRPTNLPRLTKH